MRFLRFGAGLAGLTGVVLGALGAHRFAPQLAAREMTAAWETAVLYHLVHAVALWAAAAAGGAAAPGRSTQWAAWSWLAGIVLFSGSIYLLALGGPRWLGPVTPLGGVCLIAGWLAVASGAFGKPAPGR